MGQVVREKVFRRLYKELPYELSLRDVSFKCLADGSLRIEKDILVPTDQVQSSACRLVSPLIPRRRSCTFDIMCRRVQAGLRSLEQTAADVQVW